MRHRENMQVAGGHTWDENQSQFNLCKPTSLRALVQAEESEQTRPPWELTLLGCQLSEGRGSAAQPQDLCQASLLPLTCWVTLGRISSALRFCPRERMCQNSMTVRSLQVEKCCDKAPHPASVEGMCLEKRGQLHWGAEWPQGKLSSGTSQ